MTDFEQAVVEQSEISKSEIESKMADVAEIDIKPKSSLDPDTSRAVDPDEILEQKKQSAALGASAAKDPAVPGKKNTVLKIQPQKY